MKAVWSSVHNTAGHRPCIGWAPNSCELRQGDVDSLFTILLWPVDLNEPYQLGLARRWVDSCNKTKQYITSGNFLHRCCSHAVGRHTRSSAAGWITATVRCTLSTTVCSCWRSCRQFTMQQRVLWQEPDSSTTSHWCCVNFTGFLSAIESRTSWRRSSTSAYTGWRLHTWPTTACLSQLWPTEDTLSLLTVDVLLP